VGALGAWLAPEPEVHHTPPSLRAAVVDPFKHFFAGPGAALLLAFIVLYKLGDALASSMTVTYVLRLGYSRGEYVSLVKLVGTICSLVGGIAGGFVILRTGVYRALFFFGILQACSILSLTLLETRGHDLYALGIIIGLENACFGMGTAAFVALLGSLCHRRYSATQYALLSSLSGVPRSLAGGAAGKIADALGWRSFYIFCTVLAIPGLLLIRAVERFAEERRALDDSEA
jgi:PAT family beta-lactamase induction signal transducer AmpG